MKSNRWLPPLFFDTDVSAARDDVVLDVGEAWADIGAPTLPSLWSCLGWFVQEGGGMSERAWRPFVRIQESLWPV